MFTFESSTTSARDELSAVGNYPKEAMAENQIQGKAGDYDATASGPHKKLEVRTLGWTMRLVEEGGPINEIIA